MLASVTPHPQDDRPLTDEERLDRFVEDIITLNAEGGATFGRLYELGWSPRYIDDKFDEAKRLANKRFVRSVDDDPTPPLGTVETQMAEIITGLLPSTQIIVAEMQARGFSTRHIDLLLNRARARAALAFCHGLKRAH